MLLLVGEKILIVARLVAIIDSAGVEECVGHKVSGRGGCRLGQ